MNIGDCGRLLPLPVVDCGVGLLLPRSDKYFNHGHRERSVAIQCPRLTESDDCDCYFLPAVGGLPRRLAS